MSHGPIFTQKLIYQAHSEPVSTSPETVTEDRWHQPWSEPVRQKIKPALAIALIASGLSWDPQPIPTQSDAWRQPLSEPTRKREDKIALRVRYPFIYGSVYMSWFGPLPEPVRTKIDPRLSIALIASGSSWNPQPIAPPVQNIDKWQQPLSEPVRKKENRIGLRDRYPFVASAVHIGWFGSLSEPIRIRTTLQAGLNPSIFYTPQPDPADDLSAAWIVKFTDPVRIKQGLNAANQQAAAFHPFPFPSITATIGWFNNLSDPVRRIRSTPTDQQFLPISPQTPSLDWYYNFADVMRRIRPTPTDQQFTQYLPIIPSFGWYD